MVRIVDAEIKQKALVHGGRNNHEFDESTQKGRFVRYAVHFPVYIGF